MAGWLSTVRFSKLAADPATVVELIHDRCAHEFTPSSLQRLDWDRQALGFDAATHGHPLTLGFERRESCGYGAIGDPMWLGDRRELVEHAHSLCSDDGFEGVMLLYAFTPGLDERFPSFSRLSGRVRWDLWPEPGGAGVELTVVLTTSSLPSQPEWGEWFHDFVSAASRELGADRWLEIRPLGDRRYATLDDT